MDKQTLISLVVKFITSVDYKLDVDCPTNISLTQLGKIIEDVPLDIPEPYSNFLLMKQKYVRFVAYQLLHSQDNKEEFELWMRFLAYIFVIQIFKHYIKYCDKDVLHLAISRLKHNHLFKKGIAQTVDYLAESVALRYFGKLDINNIYKPIYELRHRIVQSVKSVAKIYYEIKRNPESLSKDCDTIASNLVNQILLYGLDVNGKSYDWDKVDHNVLYELIKSLCENDKKSAKFYAATIFKALGIHDRKEQVGFIKAIGELLK